MDLTSTAPEYGLLLATIPFLPIALRKPILTLSRTQALPVEGSPTYETAKRMFDIQIMPDYSFNLDLLMSLEVPMPFGEFYERIAPYSLQPIHCGILSLTLRIAPFPEDTEIEDLISTTFQKELSASVNIYHPVRFDYRAILSDNYHERRTPFSPRIPLRPEVHDSIHDAFTKSKLSLHHKVFWPDIGIKTVGDQVAMLFWNAYAELGLEWKEDQKDRPGVNCQDLERLYMETGIEIGGPVEVRSAWKYNDLKPRVYYARGGSTYFASRYIQAFFNHVIDFFPECHRLDRFTEPENSTLGHLDSSIIYDYASFTSTMEEIRNFVHALSIFYSDVTIICVDSRVGPVAKNLGELLQEYNAVCNDHPEFDASRYMPELNQLYHTCGMLGVPGNIFSCTLLHGIHIRLIAGPGNSKTVGDDGKVYLCMGEHPDHEKEHLWFQLESLGFIQWSKMFEFEYYEAEDPEEVAKRTYNFAKRPYYRIEHRMHSGKLLTLPNPVGIIGIVDSHHNFHIDDDQKMIKVYRKQLDRLINSLPYEMVNIAPEEVQLLYDFNKATKRAFERKFHKRKKDPTQDEKRIHRLAREICPNLPDQINDFKSEWVRLYQYEEDEPISVLMPFESTLIEGREVGCRLEVTSSACLGWLTKMNFVEIEDVRMTVTRKQFGDDYVAEFLRGNYPSLKVATVIRPFPQWCMSYLLDTQI